MIIPQLLRIGNWLLSRDHGWIQVKSIYEDGITTTLYANGERKKLLFEDLKRIPLTPEILEKNGFIKVDNRTYHFSTLYFILKSDSELLVTTLQNSPLCTCVYLDEMQNAIFTLRGIELEITEPM